jgi:hypothetical protein
MHTRATWGAELETLSVNLLLQAKPGWRQVRTTEAARRLTRHCAEAFAIECLAPFAGHSWVMTTSMVVETLRCISEERRARGSRRRA